MEKEVKTTEVLVKFKHKSIKDYWSGANYQHNKIQIDVSEQDTDEDIRWEAENKIDDLMDLFYPTKNGSGFDVCYQYEITNIDKNPYKRKEK